MKAVRVAILFTLFVLFTGVATAGNENTTFKPADPGPITIGTLPKNAKPVWKGGVKQIPSGKKRCDVGMMPVVIGTTDASGGWDQEDQLPLDWARANAMIAPGGSGKWGMASVTNLKGKAAVWCIPEMVDADKTEPVKAARVAITDQPERIQLRGDNHMSSAESDTRFGARVGAGIEFIGPDLLSTVDVAFQFRKGWYVMEADVSVAWDNQDDTKRSIGWTVGLRPIGGWFGWVDVSLALRGGESSHALVDYSDEARFGIGLGLGLRPLWLLDNWAKELIEFRVEALANQFYRKGDDFDSAKFTSWTRSTISVKFGW